MLKENPVIRILMDIVDLVIIWKANKAVKDIQEEYKEESR